MTPHGFKPMLACNVNLEKLNFPQIIGPKYDGVRGLIKDTLLTRQLKPIPNRYCQKLFSSPVFRNLDGELTVGDVTDPDLCRKTTSAVMSEDGEPDVTLNVFDYFLDAHHPYRDRLNKLESSQFYRLMQKFKQIKLIPTKMVNSLEELLAQDEQWVRMGFEGTIIRSPYMPYKFGRSTMREQGLMRLKQFEDDEGEIVGFRGGESNLNPKQLNELGLTKRSSHKANKVPNGQVGTLVLKNLKTQAIVEVGAGRMTVKERIHYFLHPEEMLGQVAKYRHFKRGTRGEGALRFPTFQCFRDRRDM